MSSYPIARIDPTVAGRERSPALWNNLLDAYANDPLLGTMRSDDFHTPHAQVVDTASGGFYLSEDGTAGAAVESFNTNTSPDGVCVLVATTDIDGEGAKVQAGASATSGENVVLPSHPTLRKADVAFEARVNLDVAANDTMFVGLAEVGAVIVGAGALTAAADHIGIYRNDAGDLQFVSRNDNNGGAAVGYSVNILAAADVPTGMTKLGFRVNHDSTVEVYVDGSRIRRSTAGVEVNVPVSAMPIEVLTRTVSVARGATANNGIVSIDVDRIEVFVQE